MISFFIRRFNFPMIKKDKAQKIFRNDQIESRRRANKKINDWVANILHEAVSKAMETPVSMETPPSMDTSPWKGTHGDA